QTADRERAEAVERQIAYLVAREGQLAADRRRLAEHEAMHRTLETVRDLVRQAGPYITRQLVQRISRQASAIYADIMGDYASRLQWAEDYELTLEVRGHARGFRQLSGGEQMSAALALRLALLRETVDLDIAFFDEPTAHLDSERREGLAEKMLSVRGFAQIFVISHDDTFERAAQNYIRVVKDENGSRIEEG
ncbi:MAG: hypothetical protein V1772_09625, partial [Chloroflexota bacterium]